MPVGIHLPTGTVKGLALRGLGGFQLDAENLALLDRVVAEILLVLRALAPLLLHEVPVEAEVFLQVPDDGLDSHFATPIWEGFSLHGERRGYEQFVHNFLPLTEARLTTLHEFTLSMGATRF